MNCEQFENLMSDYLDETLSPSLRRQCAEHVIECQNCHGLLNDVQAAVHLCAEAGPVEPLTDISARILQATAAGEMMSCAVFDELILDYFDGFITASEFHIFEAHFDTCSRCQRLMTSIRLARELCQNLESVEVPEGFHERVLDATTGADHRSRQGRSEGMLQRLTRRLVVGVQGSFRSFLSPEFATAMLLCLATVGLLLVDFSDDMSLRGVYRQARLRIAGAFHEEGEIASGKEKMVSDLHQVKTQLNSVIETGMALFSQTPESDDRTPSSPQRDQKQHEEQSPKSTPRQDGADAIEKLPPAEQPDRR
ncbi:MAG: zf-HC2 domain-containing protein [Acidobacteria bacterium]|nr:zf-HC2 domain-containing protein [Acidobacteriota bacterium]